MRFLAYAFPLLILALVALAIHQHVMSRALSLPLAPALTFITILVPLLAGANAFAIPSMKRFPAILQVLQGILTTILATLYLNNGVIPSATRECELSTQWLRLFRAKDARAIRAIQAAFECCGFRSVKDMAWPFPPTEVQCAARYDRQLACQGPWTEALQRTSGVEFGVVLAVGVLQIVSILLARKYSGQTQAFSWRDVFRSRRSGLRDLSSRRLLSGHDAQADEVDEEVGETGHESARRYGAIEDSRESAPRIEPSGLQQEQNEWRDQ